MANRKDGKRSNWIKNFGKSVGYSGIDILKELSPSVFETGEQASQSVTSIMKELKDIRTGQKRLMDTMERAPIMKYSAKFVENAIKDLRTGKFNNQDRINKMIEDDMNEGMEDFDFSFDDGDGGSMSFEPSDDTEGPTIKMDTSPIAAIQPGIESTARNTGAIAMGVNQMNSNLQKQSNLIAQEFSNTNKLHGQIATTNFIMQKQFHKENVGHMTAMNENLGKIVMFNDKTIAPLAMGALKYYEDSLTVMNNMLAELQKSNKYMEKEEEEEREKDQFSLGFTSKGVMKFSNYPEIFKRNFLAAAESDPILSAVKDFVTNEDALKMFAANPLGSVSTMVAGSLIPQMIKTSMKQFDLSLASFFPSLFAKINKGMDSDNPLVSMLSKIFGLNVELHSAPSFSNYKKDAVPFDGITHKTINSVIPNYLSGILAALTGKEEMVMDYESGTFKSKDRLKKDLDDKYKNALLDPFSKVMREMTESIEATVTLSKQMQKDVQDNMETLFTNMAESGKLFNPTSDNMSDLGVTDRSIQKLFKQAMLNMTRGQQMSMNTAMFKARNNTSYLSELEKTPDLMLNYLAAYGGLPFDGHITRQEADRSKYKVNRNTMLGLQEDEYGDTLHSLLRDIKETLMEGITTYPILESSGRGGRGGNRRMNAIMRARLDRMKGKKTRKEQEIYDAEMESVLESSLTSDEVDAAKEEGMITQAELMQMGNEELGAMMKFRRDAKRGAGKGPRQMGGLYEQIDKGLSHFNIGGFFGKIKQGIQDVLHKPLELFTDAIDTIDKGMYTIIYGPDGDGNKSIVTATIESVKSSFNKLTGWMKKRMDSVSEWLFGAKGFMGTKAMEWLVDKKNSIVDYLFGEKQGADGPRKGGAMSGAWNALSDMMLDVRSALFGTKFKDSNGVEHPENKNSIFHSFKDGLIKGFNHLGDYLFGKSDPNKPKKPFLDRITDQLSIGFTNFSNFFFGSKFSTEAGKAEFAQTMDTFKKHLPKALAVGIVGAGVGMFTNFGILGSLILPGGPIGGAILGIAGSFLSQSEQFKKFLFGPKGVDGSRIGGFISKATMNWFAKHKTALLGGAMFGGVKGLINMSGVLNLLGPVGYLGSMILPGGPIGGALMGAAVGLATKTATFQNFLYGKVGAGGAKIGGILNTEFGKGLKKHLPNMAFGALSFGAAGTVIGQMGILGSMLTPGGPIGAAIIGAAVGIGVSSEKFKRALFGYDDKEMGVHKAGLFQKVGGLISESIVKPFRFFMEETSLNVKYWFIESIANPFRDALEPLRTQFKYMLDGMKNMMKSGWEATKQILNDTFVNAVGKPIGKFLEQDVMKPIRNMMHKLVGGIGKMLGAIISSPFKALGFVAAGFRRSQEQRGVREQQDRSVHELIHGNEAGDGFWTRGKNVLSAYFSSDKKEAAKDIYAPYRKAEDERIAKRNAETATEKAHQYAELAARRAKADEVRKQRFASGFDSKLPPEAQTAAATATLVDVVDGEGGTNHILKRVYNTLKSGFARLTNNKDFENADRANGFVPLSNTENAIIKAHRDVGIPDELKNPGLARAEEVKAKKAEQAGAPASETGVKKNNGASPIGGLGFDLQLFAAGKDDDDSGEEAGDVAGTVKKAINRRKKRQRAYRRKKAAAKARQREEQAGKAAGMEEGMATKYLRIISEAVDGQLDGVGSNVYKIRKMLEESMGMDGDSHGSGNKDRKGFFGRIKGFFRNPISTVVGLLKTPFEYVTKKIGAVVDTIGNVVSAAWGAVKSIGGMVYDVGASVGKALLAIPQAAVDLASSIFAIGKEVAVSGVRILAKASLGLVDGMVTVITGATKAVGHVLEGIGGALKYTFDGLGKLAGGILKGVGTAIDNVVDLAGTIASTTVKMVGAGFQMMGDLAIQGVKAIGKASTAVIDGITSVVSSVAELVASPFKLLGAAARNIIGKSQQHVIIDGGVIDRVKIVEVIQRVDTLGELESAPIPGSEAGPISGGSASTAARKMRHVTGLIRRRMRRVFGLNGNPLAGGMDLQMFAGEGSGIASAGGIASNLTASDIEAGVKADENGRIQRTASVMSNIKNTLKEKLFMKNNEMKQTELLGEIAGGQKEQSGFWKKVMGMLVPGVLAAIAWLKKLKFPTSQVIKDTVNTIRQEVLQILEKRFPGAASRFAATKAGAAALARNSFVARAARQFGKKVGGVVTKVKDFGIKNMPGLSERFGWKTSGQQAIADMAEHDAAMRGGLKAPIEGEVNGKFNMPERPGGISNNQIPKNALDDVAEFGKPTAQAAESNGESLAAKVRSMFKSGLKTLEQKASKAAGKALKFADKILEKFLSKITGSFVSRFAGRFTVAIASVAGAVGSLGTLEAIFAVWNTTTGFMEAANLFRVNKDAVTVPMRLVASLVKAVTGSPFLAIVNLVLELIAMLLGVNYRNFLCNMLYKFIADDKSIAELEAKQAAFEQEALDAGYGEYDEDGNLTGVDVDKYNDETNKTIFDKAWDSFVGFKNSVGAGIDSVSDTVGGVIDGIKNFDFKDKLNNTLAWFFGVDISKVERFGDRLKNYTDRVLVDIFGEEGYYDEEGNYVEGKKSKLGMVKEGIENALTKVGENLSNFWEDSGIPRIWRGFKNWLGGIIFGETSTVDENGDVNIITDPDAQTNLASDKSVKGVLQRAVMKLNSFFGLESKTPTTFWDIIFGAISTPVRLLGKSLSSVFKWGVSKVGKWIFGDDDSESGWLADFDESNGYSRSTDTWNGVTPTFTGENAKENAKTPAFMRADFSGSGKGFRGRGDYSQNDPRWKNTSFGPLGTMGDSGCGPTAMASVLSDMGADVSPIDMASIAETGGYRVPGGTEEGFFGDVASHFGINSSHLNGVGDIVSSLARGQDVIVGGTSSGDGPGNPFTRNGHYSRVIGIDGDRAIMSDPRGSMYSGSIPLNVLQNQMQTGYAFGGPGDGGGAVKSALDSIFDDIAPAGELPRSIVRAMKESLFGPNGIFPMSYDDIVNRISNVIEWFAGGIPGGNLLVSGFKKATNWVLGGTDEEGNYQAGIIGQIYNDSKAAWERVSKWIFPDNPSDVDSMPTKIGKMIGGGIADAASSVKNTLSNIASDPVGWAKRVTGFSGSGTGVSFRGHGMGPKGSSMTRFPARRISAARNITRFAGRGGKLYGPPPTRPRNVAKDQTFRGTGPSSITGDDILKAAEEYLGTKYDFGGTTHAGIDCSALVQNAFRACGIDIERTADFQFVQMKKLGGEISQDELKPGDLIFFHSGQNGEYNIGHVGIYAGNNMMLNSASSTGVAYANLADYWGGQFERAASIQKAFGIPNGKGVDGNNKLTLNGGKGSSEKKKPRGLMDLLGHIGSIYGNAAEAMLGGKLYTGTSWEDEDSSSGGSSSGAEVVNMGDNEKTTWATLRKDGFTEAGAAGVMGNIWQESKFNPRLVQTFDGEEFGREANSVEESGEGRGYGLVQWTYPTRKEKLAAFARAAGKPSGDLGVQLQFMLHEAQTDHKPTYDQTKVETDPYNAAYIWDDGYEGSGVKGDRFNKAVEFYNQFKGSGSGIRGRGSDISANIANVNAMLAAEQTAYDDGPQTVNSGYVDNLVSKKNTPYGLKIPTALLNDPRVKANREAMQGKTGMSVDLSGVATDEIRIPERASVAQALANHKAREEYYKNNKSSSSSGEKKKKNFWASLFGGFDPAGVMKERFGIYGEMLTNGISPHALEDSNFIEEMRNSRSARKKGKSSSLISVGKLDDPVTGTNLGKALPDYSKWTGGEYFNRPEMITAAAKAYYAGTGKIGDMAVSVGLPRFPRSDTLLTLEQQMMLGCREYNKVRTWMMFLKDAELRRAQSKKSSADQWAEHHDFSASGRGIRRKDRFSGSGMKRLDTSSLLRSHNSAVGGGSGRFRGGEGLTGASEATLIKAVELLAELVNISGGINAGINNLGENIVVSNRNGSQTRVISLNGGNPVGNQRMMESAKSEYDIHRKIAAGGSF